MAHRVTRLEVRHSVPNPVSSSDHVAGTDTTTPSIPDKKSVGYFRPQRIAEVYAAVEAILQEEVAGASQVCRFLNVSRSAFYAWKGANSTPHEKEDLELAPLVRTIFQRHRRRYGTRRIASELSDMGRSCSRRRVAKLLQSQGLKAIQPKSYKPRTTESRHRLGYSPNLLLEGEEADGIDHLWVGDITYIPVDGRPFSYLATLMDRFSRRIVGWQLACDMTETLVLAALKEAIRSRQPGPGMIHHTDRGGQYAGAEYRGVLRRAAMRQSMSRADNCYDNAFMESCFGTFKTELEMTEYANHTIAFREIGGYIAYYNHERKHSALGYLTPAQFETHLDRSK
ncbi:Integrase core domain protein [Pirellulimonas nuda]|uniref:Integrase core domain protein n=1 Tax=Pirellulimonas nuda TaxID=2528009 RepID=A0A518DDE4_9BACT|nr:IS3 family transposase [Pirellulimonas nuda]QDU89499.1 Integrase core domain protein [Pirellulimonas nuda]